ncbi:MAG: LON peptidase substrate-binding domain-containing protein [Gammaproteobacteria bacterium]
MHLESVPMFPLRAVLYPGGPLPLRIFEPRYLDMVGRCVKEQSPFGVLLLMQGSEVGKEVRTQPTGTLARIVDWNQGADGLLGITAIGEDRFRLLKMHQQEDGLNTADIEVLPPEPEIPVPAEHKVLADLLQAAFDDLGEFYTFIEKRFDDASWVGFRFAEILPIDMQSKQYCLELDDPLARLEFIRPYLREMREEQAS